MKKAKSILQGFRQETIRKFLQIAALMVAHYIKQLESGNRVEIVISKGNRKIGYVPNVSLMPMLTCPNCRHCKSLCYDIKACLQYANVLRARAKNTALLLNAPSEYWAQINAYLDHTKKTVFRFHVGGEIKDFRYFLDLIETVKSHPNIRFWTYTKSYAIVNQWIHENGNLPSNLSVMFSVWKEKDSKGNIRTIEFPNPYNLPTFTIRFAEEKKPNMMKCKGDCQYCIDHNCGCIARQSVYADAH